MRMVGRGRTASCCRCSTRCSKWQWGEAVGGGRCQPFLTPLCFSLRSTCSSSCSSLGLSTALPVTAAPLSSSTASTRGCLPGCSSAAWPVTYGSQRLVARTLSLCSPHSPSPWPPMAWGDSMCSWTTALESSTPQLWR